MSILDGKKLKVPKGKRKEYTESDDSESSIKEESYDEEEELSDEDLSNNINNISQYDENNTISENSKECLSGGEDSNSNDASDIESSKIKQNPGWADAMAKILRTNKPKRKKTIVLAKAKKNKVASGDCSENVSFEIEGRETDEKPKIKEENESDVKIKGKKLEAQLLLARRIRKKELEAKGRLKPSALDKDREKVLSRVATKGVVQLFNAVRQQQISLEKEIKKVGSSDAKKDKILKSVDKKAFLDVLMGAKSETVRPIKDEPESKSDWSVLRDDFMMGTKLKDWDKDEDDGVKEEIA